MAADTTGMTGMTGPAEFAGAAAQSVLDALPAELDPEPARLAERSDEDLGH